MSQTLAETIAQRIDLEIALNDNIQELARTHGAFMAGPGKTQFHSPKGWFAVIRMHMVGVPWHFIARASRCETRDLRGPQSREPRPA